MRATTLCASSSFLRVAPRVHRIFASALFAVTCLLVATTVRAELFKCVANGQTAYQDHPCAATSKSEALQIGAAKSAWAGCYEIDFPGFDSATPHSIERWRVSQRGADDFDVESLAAPVPAVLHMKNASADEIEAVGNAFGLRIRDGISMKWDKDTPNQKPAGLYRFDDRAEGSRVLAYFFLANGFAKPVTCR